MDAPAPKIEQPLVVSKPSTPSSEKLESTQPSTPETSDMLSTLPVLGGIPKVNRSSSLDSATLTQYSRDVLLRFQGTPRCKQLPAQWDSDRLKTIMFNDHVNDIQKVIEQLHQNKGQQVKLNEGFNISAKDRGARGSVSKGGRNNQNRRGSMPVKQITLPSENN